MMRLSREIEIAAAERDGRLEISPLQLYDLQDRAYAFVDGLPVGATGVVGNEQRPTDPATIELTPFADRLLPDGGRRTVRVDLLVESLGRVNFGPRLGERKGILGGVWQTIRFLNDWQVDPWPLEEMGEELAALLEGAPAAGGDEDAARSHRRLLNRRRRPHLPGRLRRRARRRLRQRLLRGPLLGHRPQQTLCVPAAGARGSQRDAPARLGVPRGSRSPKPASGAGPADAGRRRRQ